MLNHSAKHGIQHCLRLLRAATLSIMSVEQAASSSTGRSSRRRPGLRWFMLLALATGAWSAWYLFAQQSASATLPGGVRVYYYGSSAGRQTPDTFHYSHPGPPEESHLIQDSWHKLREAVPDWLSSELPEW